MSLSQLADYAEWSRSEFLYDGGLHANAYAMLSAMVFAILLGLIGDLQRPRERAVAIATMVVATIVVVLTFSRSAIIALIVVGILKFWRASVVKRAVLALSAVLATAFFPTQLFERFTIGVSTGDVDRFSSGRLENIWLPLLSDVSRHLWFGQGHYSIYWTQVQQDQTIYPVVHSHNALLDLLLDYGVVGALAILAFYLYVWHQFWKLSRRDLLPEYRAIFSGATLAMVPFVISGLNGRFTPEPVHFPLWIAVGFMLGRQNASLASRDVLQRH